MTRHAFSLVLIATVIVLAILAIGAPLVGDDWGHYLTARSHLSFADLVSFARESHAWNNPRWGQLLLVLAFRTPVFPLVITPLAVVAVVYLGLALVRGRWPSLREPRLATRFVALFGLLLLATPQVGPLFFYRANATNYLYPFVLQLLWLVPYRFLVEESSRDRRPLLAIAIVPLGFLAGASNEHTGVGLALAGIAACVIVVRRDRRIPVWPVLGLLALIAGNVFLLTAPAQSIRYGGIGAHTSAIGTLLGRGTGNISLVIKTMGASTIVMLALVVAGVLARWRPQRAVIYTAIAAVGLGVVILGTSLGAPIAPARLLAAPAFFVLLACAAIADAMATDLAGRSAARWLDRAVWALAAGLLVALAVVTLVAGADARARRDRLLAAPPGSTVAVDHWRLPAPGHFSWGDDFRSEKLRQAIATELGLQAITW